MLTAAKHLGFIQIHPQGPGILHKVKNDVVVALGKTR